MTYQPRGGVFELKVKKRLRYNFRGNSRPFTANDPRRWTKGAPKQPPEVKKLKNMTTADFVLGFNDLLRMGDDELQKLYDDKSEPILRTYLARCLLLGSIRGDYYTINLMMDRIIGKVKEPRDPDQIDTLKELLKSMVDNAKAAAKGKK